MRQASAKDDWSPEYARYLVSYDERSRTFSKVDGMTAGSTLESVQGRT